MSTYKLTAADRRALAQMNSRSAKRNTIRSKSALANSSSLGEMVADDNKKDANPLIKAGHTIGDLSADIVFGAGKGVEGIIDLGAGLVGLIGGLFSDDFEDNVKDFIETDWVGKVADPVDSFFEHSYTNGSTVGRIIEGAASGIGQMLPSVAVTIATAGAGAGTMASQIAGLATLGVSASGTGAEEAYKDGADFERGLAYGAASGLTEVATEKLLPGPADAIFGKAIFKQGASEIAEQGAKRVIKEGARNALNEGFEEMSSEVTNPLRKTIYKGRDALNEYGEKEFWLGVGEAGATGALTSAGYGATVGKAYSKAKGLNGDIDASISSIEKLNDNKARLQERGELNDASEAEIDAKIEQNLKQIEAVLGKSSASDRAKYIKNYKLSGRFSEDGVLNAKAEDTSGLDKQYVSADARGQEERIKAALDKEGVTAYHGELSERGSEALKEVYKAHNALNKLGFAGKHVVIVNEMTDTNAYLDGDIIAIGKDMLESGEHIKKLVRETTHFTEGSKEWAQVADFVFGKDASKVKTNLAKEISAVLKGGYGITQADVDAVVEHIASGYETKLTAKQGELIEKVVANRMENMFGDSESIERICREKPSLAKRIWERIKALIDSLGQSSSERQEIKKLRETERLFRAALEVGGQDYIRGEMESETVVHYSKSENSSIKEQLREHLDEVNSMEPVASVSYTPTTKKAEEKELYYASLLRTSENLLNVEKGKFFSASIYNGNTLKQIPGILRSALRNAREVTGGIRKSLLTVKEWYNSPENGMLFKKTDDNELAAADGQILFDEDVSAFLEEICEGEGALTLTELKKLDKIGSYFLKVAERYQRVFIDGKWVDADKLAEDKVSVMATAQKNRTFITNGIGNSYMRQFGEPASLCRCVDGYDPDGFFTWWFEAMRNAGVNIEVDSMNTLSAYREWHKAHKKWGDHLENDTVTYRGQKIPIQIAMTLYCSLKTRKSQQGLADSGYEWREGKNNEVRKDKGLIEKTDAINKKSKKNRRRAVEAACKAAENELWSMFSESDRQYIQMFESILNKECRKWKIETDKQMKGFSLVSEDGEYYFPTVRAHVNKTVTGANYEGDRVAHLSSNKNVVEGARGSLLLEPIDAVVLRHIRNQLLYKHYAIVAENVSMLMNINVGNNVHNPVTLKTMIEKGGKSSQELLRMMEKLSKDLQGTPSGEKAEQRFIYEMIEFMRSGYAKYQLGANPKTLFSQLSSLIAACNILDFTSLARGMKGFVNSETAHEVDKYCPIAELRNTDNVAAKAQGVIDKTGKVGDFLMKGIGFVDRRVVCALFNACQIQVEKDSGLKLGTEENKVEAGKLLSKVILETQQNTFVTERSDAMRGGVFARSFTMFSADSMKTMARWLDSIGKVSVLKRQIKNSTDQAEIKALESELKKANGQLVRSSAVIVSQAIFMALLAWGFRWLYNKDDEPDEEAKKIGADFLGNMLGGLPLLRDVYSYFSDGYELDNFMISTINDVLIASKKSMDLAVSAMKGEPVTKQKVASSIKNTLYSAGQVLGIPVRNVYNFSTGITRRFFPEAGYKVDDFFYKQSYNADLQKAIEKGDEDMVETITGLILDESIGGVKDKGVRSQITKLSQKGYSVLPRSIGDTLTYDGEEIALTKKQQNRFKELYSAANEGAAKLVGSSLYNRADDAAQAKAIKFLYDTYYNLALQEVLDVDLESKNVLFAEAIDIEDLAIIYSIASGIEADKDRKGNVISGSRKAKIEKYVESLRMSAAEKYLIMGYLGYKCKNGADKVKAYVSRLNLTKDEKDRLMEYCGYAA